MGGDTTIQQPSAPPAPSTAEAVTAYTQNLPAMYQAQLEWQPKLAAQDIAMLEQYLPQVTALSQQLQNQYAPEQAAMQWQLQQQYGPLLAEQQQQLQQQYQPEAYAAQQALGQNMNADYLNNVPMTVATDPTLQGMQSFMTPDWMQGYSAQEAPGMQAARDRLTQQARGAWADRGLAQSGMSAEDETRMLSEFELLYALQQEQLTQQVNQQRQQLGMQLGAYGLQSQQNSIQNYYDELARRQNVALSMAGKYAPPGQTSVTTPQVNIPNYTAPNVMSGYTFPQVQNSMMQGYGNYSSLYGNMYGTNAQYLPTSSLQNFSNQVGYLQSGIGGIGQIGSSIMSMFG